MPSDDRVTSGPTFGEMLEHAGLIEKPSMVTREIIRATGEAVAEYARVNLVVVSCVDCTAPKACCWLKTKCYLHEAVPIVARLLRDGRDTPELRAELRAAAHYMENAPKRQHQRPCVFLDGEERCTVYEDRPSVCGTHLVSSPATECSGLVGNVRRLSAPLQDQAPPEIEEEFVLAAGLRRLDRRYACALPRMVLICLEAWPRRDYVSFLAERVLPAAHRFHAITR